MWVFDATPLIYLARIDRLDLLQGLDDQCIVPKPVYEEVVETGIQEGYPDARRVEESIDANTVDVVTVENTPMRSRLRENRNLSEADVAVLVAANSHDGVAVMDETYGRDVASAEGITTRGTAYLVLKAASDGTISKEEARSIIDSMIEEGWYCAPDVYAKIVRKIESLAE